MSLTLYASACALLLVLFGCSSKTENNPVVPPVVTAYSVGSIHGTIFIGSTGEPLRAVTIVTVPPTQAVISDSSGRFRIDRVPAGIYNVSASRSGYASRTVAIRVVSGDTALADIQLMPIVVVTEPPVIHSPTPLDSAAITVADPVLGWICDGPAVDSLTFHLLLGESASRLDTIARDLSGRSFHLPTLLPGKT